MKLTMILINSELDQRVHLFEPTNGPKDHISMFQIYGESELPQEALDRFSKLSRLLIYLLMTIKGELV